MRCALLKSCEPLNLISIHRATTKQVYQAPLETRNNLTSQNTAHAKNRGDRIKEREESKVNQSTTRPQEGDETL